MERHTVVATIPVRTVKCFPFHGVLAEQSSAVQTRIPRTWPVTLSHQGSRGTLPKHPQRPERVAFGLPELDQLLGGGLPAGTTTLLAGAPGVGKTTLGLFWAVAEARPDAQTLFVTFSEQPDQLVLKASAFGLDLETAQATQTLRILRISPTDVDPDWVAAQVLGELASGTVSRVVFDDIAVLIHELGERTRNYLSALNENIYRTQVTCLYLLEIAPFDGLRVELANTPLAVLGDNVIVVQQFEIHAHLRRILAVLRMRLSFFDRTLRELVLDETGVRLLPPEESAAGVLHTGARLGGGVAPANDTAPQRKDSQRKRGHQRRQGR